MLGITSAWKELSGIGTCCPGNWLIHQPWRYFKRVDVALRDTSCLVHLDWGPKENIVYAPQAGMQTDFQDKCSVDQVIDYNSPFIVACCERSCLACGTAVQSSPLSIGEMPHTGTL